MTKLQLQNIYLSRLGHLSYKARLVLSGFEFDKFEYFFNFFIEKRKTFSWSKMENCGYKTENELNDFIQVITYYGKNLLPQEKERIFNEKQELMFNSGFEKLGVRTKNILSGLGLNDIESFVSFIIKNNKLYELNKVQNCGNKTIHEVELFKQEVLTILSSENIEYCFPTKDPVGISGQEIKIEEQILKTDFNGRIELFFDKEFDKLNIRTKNILISINANEIGSFVNKVINNETGLNLLSIRNCGEKTKGELEIFKNIILNEILVNKDSLSVPKLFEDLDIYFKERNVLKGVEFNIFTNYYCFIKEYTYESLSLIAQNSYLTTERVRQISVRLLEKIKKIISNIDSKGKYSHGNYFQELVFNVSQSLSDSINKNECTNFSSAFITIVLSQLNKKEYDFICIENNPRVYSGIFVKKLLQIDYIKFFEFLFDLLNSKRKKNLKLSLIKLINRFSIETHNITNTDPINIDATRKQVIGMLNLLFQSNHEIRKQVEIDSDLITIRRNTKILKHEYLIDILNECKKPMHYTDLYKECLNRKIDFVSALNVHSTMSHYPKVFGLKGPGIYGLIEWGGYFGTIGDVTEKLLKERKSPIGRKELENILCRELYISQDSIINVLLRYEHEKRFVILKNKMISLKEWT